MIAIKTVEHVEIPLGIFFIVIAVGVQAAVLTSQHSFDMRMVMSVPALLATYGAGILAEKAYQKKNNTEADNQ